MIDLQEQINLQNKISQVESEIGIGYTLAIQELEQYDVSLDILSSKENIEGFDELFESLACANQTDTITAYVGVDALEPGLLGNAVTEFLTKIWDAFVGFLRKIGEFLGLLEKEADSKSNMAAKEAMEEVKAFMDSGELKESDSAYTKLKEELEKSFKDLKSDVKGAKEAFKDSKKLHKILASSSGMAERFKNFVLKRDKYEVKSKFKEELENIENFIKGSSFIKDVNEFTITTVKAVKDIFDELLKGSSKASDLKDRAEKVHETGKFKEASKFGSDKYEVSPAKEGKLPTIRIIESGTEEVHTLPLWKMEEKEKAAKEWTEVISEGARINKISTSVAEKLNGKEYAKALAELKKQEGGKEAYVILKGLPGMLLKNTSALAAIVSKGKKSFGLALKAPNDIS